MKWIKSKVSVDWFEEAEQGCVVSPQGGGMGYAASCCNSVEEEEVVLTGVKPWE